MPAFVCLVYFVVKSFPVPLTQDSSVRNRCFIIHLSAFILFPWSLPENVNYAVKSSRLLSFLESVPEVAAKFKEPSTKDESVEEVVKSAQAAAVLVLVY